MMETSSLVVLVRSVADLPRACADVSELLSLRCRRLPSPRSQGLLGLWVDSSWTEIPLPHLLPWHDPATGRRTVHIRESAGVDGIWMLCWLDRRAGGSDLSRHALLASLLRAFGRNRAQAPPCFVPVFALDAPPLETQAEVDRLATDFGDLLQPPIFCNPHSGRLDIPALGAPGPGGPH